MFENSRETNAEMKTEYNEMGGGGEKMLTCELHK
jgi:hypothetical protein